MTEKDPKNLLEHLFETLVLTALSNICSSFCRADTGSAAPWQTPAPALGEPATRRK
jgi:hypothetical protein